MNLHLPDVGEEQMTWRARAYLMVTALQHVLVGLACILLGGTEAFEGDAFRVVRAIFSMPTWGVIFLLGGLHLTIAAFQGSERLARIGMPMSAGVTSLWAASFVLAWHGGGVVSPVGAIFASSLTLKDLIVCAQPMRSPFEPLVKEYAGASRSKGR